MHDIREVIYLSETKLNRMFLDPRLSGPYRQGVKEASVGALGASAHLTFPEPDPGMRSDALSAQRLERVIEFLEKRDYPDYRSRNLRADHWIRFDLPMAWGTMHEDSSTLPDDVVVFGGVSDGEQEKVRLLLCGSISHLRTECSSADRMGSGTRWMYDVIKELETREQRGLLTVPEFLTQVVPADKGVSSIEEVAHWVYGVITQHQPVNHWGRKRGYARVLMNVESTDFIERLVVGTPLYVENPHPPVRRAWWQRKIAETFHRKRRTNSDG